MTAQEASAWADYVAAINALHATAVARSQEEAAVADAHRTSSEAAMYAIEQKAAAIRATRDQHAASVVAALTDVNTKLHTQYTVEPSADAPPPHGEPGTVPDALARLRELVDTIHAAASQAAVTEADLNDLRQAGY